MISCEYFVILNQMICLKYFHFQMFLLFDLQFFNSCCKTQFHFHFHLYFLIIHILITYNRMIFLKLTYFDHFMSLNFTALTTDSNNPERHFNSCFYYFGQNFVLFNLRMVFLYYPIASSRMFGRVFSYPRKSLA